VTVIAGHQDNTPEGTIHGEGKRKAALVHHPKPLIPCGEGKSNAKLGDYKPYVLVNASCIKQDCAIDCARLITSTLFSWR